MILSRTSSRVFRASFVLAGEAKFLPGIGCCQRGQCSSGDRMNIPQNY
jgi:hypothetical protein